MTDDEIYQMLLRTKNLALAVHWMNAMESRKMLDWKSPWEGLVKKK